MKKSSGVWILVIFGLFIVVALLVSTFMPVSLGPMDPEMIEKGGTTVIMPNVKTNLPVLADSMPDFVGITKWLNTQNEQPLTKEDLEGKVVMIDFWTYSCINCIRTQPVLKGWWETYKDDDFILIGVHTPEFAFEKEEQNVRRAAERAGLEYPIALDPNYETWRAYNNRYWPAAYFFDRQGRLRFTHFGEGEYDKQEEVIRTLIAEGGELEEGPTGLDSSATLLRDQTHETYFGYARASGFEIADEYVRGSAAAYTLMEPGQDRWSIGGEWFIDREFITNKNQNATFSMNVKANAMHLVLGAVNGAKRVRVQIDDRDPQDDELTEDTIRGSNGEAFITITHKDLYRIARFPDMKRHKVTLTVQDSGLEFYAATFGE